MNKNELVEAIAEKMGTTKKEAEADYSAKSQFYSLSEEIPRR